MNELLAIIEKFDNNKVILDALYQWSDNPTSMSANYGINANKSFIASNLKIRYKNLFDKNTLDEFFSDMDSLASKGQDQYWIDEIRKEIREIFDEKYSSDFKRKFIESVIRLREIEKSFIKCFIYASKLLSSVDWMELYDKRATSIYSLALSIFSSMADNKAPNKDELIKLGLINSFNWKSSGRNKNSAIEYRIPVYLSKYFDEIDDNLEYPYLSSNVKNFLKRMIDNEEFEQVQLIDCLLIEGGFGNLSDYDDLISRKGIIGKGSYHVSINPVFVDDLRGELLKWKAKMLDESKNTLEIVIKCFKKKYKVKFGAGWQENLRRIEFLESPEFLFEINTWITRSLLRSLKSIGEPNQIIAFIIQNQSIPSVKRVLSQENFNLEYIVLFLEENKIIKDSVKNIQIIPDILDEIINEWNNFSTIKEESPLESGGESVKESRDAELKDFDTEVERKKEIFIGCAGYWEANNFHFRIKIKNDTAYVITNVSIMLDKYPSMLEIIGDKVKETPELEPNGAIWTPKFILNAGNECISGIISSSVKYYDHMAKKISREVRDLEISYICPLLEAKNVSEIEYLRITREMGFQEGKIVLEGTQDTINLLDEIKEELSNMNLSIVDLQGKSNEIVGYAEDKFNRDGLALEVKIENMEGKLELILKALCEHDNKCAPLLHKAIQEISKMRISGEKEEIREKLSLFIDKPNDLRRYLKRIVKSDWSDDKKDKWAQIVLEILEDWKSLKPPKYKRIVESLLVSISSKIVGEELTDLMTEGIQKILDKISE